MREVLHLDLRKCTTFTRFYMIDLNRSPKTAVMFQYVSWANLVSVDFGHVSKLWQKVDEILTVPISWGETAHKELCLVSETSQAMRI